MALKRAGCVNIILILSKLSLVKDPPGKLDLPGHDGDTHGMDGAQVGVLLKQTNKVGLAGLLTTGTLSL